MPVLQGLVFTCILPNHSSHLGKLTRRYLKKYEMNHKSIHIKNIAENLRSEFLDKKDDSSEISIFLCGGATKDQASLRRAIGNELTKIRSKYAYTIHYPEDMFMELIFGYKKHDLLSLENLLANSVHVVVILLQSPGTLVELGAFANHQLLCEKLVVVVDSRHERKKSFVNLGPIRFLKENTKSQVFFTSLTSDNLPNITQRLADLARKVYRGTTRDISLENPLASADFYLSLVHTFDPLPRNTIPGIVSLLGASDTVITSAESIINTLIKSGNLTLKHGNISITQNGKDSLFHSCKNLFERRRRDRYLSQERCKALNLTLRGKEDRRNNFWESVARI